MIKVCYKCDKLIAPREKYFLYPLDRPYVNLFFHRNCIESIGDVMEFLLLDVKKVFDYANKSKPKVKELLRG